MLTLKEYFQKLTRGVNEVFNNGKSVLLCTEYHEIDWKVPFKLTRCRHHGKRCKHCMKHNPVKSCALNTVEHCLVLQRLAIRRAIGLMAIATFNSL